MSSNFIRTAVTGTLALAASLTFGQLAVSPQTDLIQLARAITGPGVVIANPQVDCHDDGFGEFQYSGSLLGIDEGILLTSGTISNAVGPNDVEDKTFSQGRPGNTLLDTVTGRETRDACKFEFDVIPAGDSLRFDFVFASEEYNEWVGSQYNDVFGFFISGPGIIGDPGIGNDKNIALVPGTNQAVTINNVNNGSNASFYFDNAGGQYVQYDGFTTGLSAISQVQPCETYHLKLVVADASDRKYDSGVFIAKVESNPVTLGLITQNGSDSLIEGCNNGLIRFTRQTVTNQPLTLEYYLHGTAINGTDYTAIGDVNPSLPKTIIIPANQASADQAIQLVADNMPDSPETILVILGNPDCPGTVLDTLVIPVLDSLNATVSPVMSNICIGGQVDLLATGGAQYAWSPAAGLSATNVPSPSASPSVTTTYTVNITHGACSATLQSTVNVSNITGTASITPPLCAGAANGAINLSVAGGIPPYSFLWSGPGGFTASTEDIASIAAGTYTVTITDAACSKTMSFNVGQPPPLSVSLAPSLLIFGQNISCHGGNDGSIDATITGGTSPYGAGWTGPGGFTSNAVDIGNLIAGTYNVTITDANGCTATAGITLTESAPMAAEITDTTHVACANDQDGSATVTVTGGMPIYTYNWSTVPVQGTATATSLNPGSYTVTATDQYGCTVSSTVTIEGPTVPLTVQLTAKTNVSCHGAANGSATISVSGGTPGYTVAWNTNPVQTGLTASGLAGGTYAATVTDANGCTATLQVVILEPALALSLSIAAQENVACHGEPTGSATVQASGGTGPYSYSWNTVPVQNGATASGLPAGTYTATATDIHGCTATQTVVITAPTAALTASIGSFGNVTCAGEQNGTATVNVSGGTAPYTFQWNTTPAQLGSTATALPPGTWEVLVTDELACSTTASVTITEPSPLAVSGVVEPAQCQGAADGAVDASVSGGTSPYTYAWNGPGGFTTTTEDITGVPAGGYSLTVTDALGCSSTTSFDINQPGLFTVSSTVSIFGNANVSCPASTNGSIDLTVTGAMPPYSFSWTGPGGFTSVQEDPTGLAAGSYQVSITDDNGCSTGHDVILSAPPAISAQLTLGVHGNTSVSCFGGNDGSINTAISGGNAPYTTSWSGPNGFISAAEDLMGLEAGSYQLSITNANGCSTTQTAVLTAPNALAATPAGSTPVSCHGSSNGQATVQAAGGTAPYTYAWATVPPQFAATATGLPAGTYGVTVTDANGCTASTSVTVAGPSAPLSVSFPFITHVLCHGGQTGAATAQATGGTAPYTWAWNTVPVNTDATASGLTAGTWSVTVTDANGCTATGSVVITQPQQPITATVSNTQPVTCYGDDDGSGSIQVAGGSGNYNIVWNTVPVQTGSTINGLAPGTYTATITDANGCAQALQYTLTIGGPSAPVNIALAPFTYPGGAHVSCPGNSDGSIEVTVTGGTPTYQYHWQDGLGNIFTTEDPSGLAAGTYHLIVGDGHGCFTDTTITLVAPVPMAASATVQSAICHGDSNGSIDLSVVNGVAPFTYQWSGPDGFTASTADLSQLAAGVYTVTITDANNCQLVQPFDVTEPGMFIFNAVQSEVSCSNSDNGSIQVTASGGTPPYWYSWIGPNGFTATTADISGLAPGSYHLTLTDGNGCSALYSTTLAPPAPLTAFVISVKNHGGYDISCAGAADGQIITQFDGGTPPYTFSWSGPNSFTASTADIDNLAAGTYTLTITDANGCTVTSSTTLMEPPPISATAIAQTFAGGAGVSCYGSTDGGITLTPAGGAPPYTVVWTGPGGFTSGAWQLTGLAAGTYTATVADGNGCSTSVSATLTAPAPISLATSSIDLLCNGGSDGAIDLQVSGGTAPYAFQWYGPGVFTATTEDLSGTIAGSYTVTVTDANGCTATHAETLAQPTAIELTAAITTAACQGASTGAIDLAVTGGTGPYTYAWTGFPAFSATTEDISSLLAGVYTVTVTDAAGCTSTQAYNVGQPGLFQITAVLSTLTGGYHVSCADAMDGSIDATVSGGTAPYSYFWNGPNGFTSISLDLNGLAAGTYSLTVHDANGCNATQSFTLVAPSPLQVGLVATSQPACAGGQEGSIDAFITGGNAPYTISWTGPDGPLGISPNLTGVGAGTYVAQITDALGCSTSASITLNNPIGLDVQATATDHPNGYHVSCADATDGSIGLVISGGTAPYQVNWTGPNGFQANQEDIANLMAGTYTVSITDANGCNAAAQVVLSAPSPLASSLTTSVFSNGHAVSCAGAADGTITLAVSGGSPGYTVTWSGPGGFSSQQTSLQGLAPGTYNVTIIDDAGCAAYNSVTLTAPLPITTTAVLSDHGGYEVGCNGQDGSIDLSVAGGLAPYQFNWNGPNGFASSNEDIVNLAVGTYTVQITDANNCTTSRSFTLTAPDNLQASLAVTNNACDTSSNAAIDLTISGGVAPFTILWTGPGGFTSSDEDIASLASGVYAVTVTSATGCTANAQATVIPAAPITLDLYASQYGAVNIACHGASTGTIELTVTGGHAPLDIAWVGPGGFLANTANINGLAAGTYQATITDSQGCVRDTSITLTEPDSILSAAISTADLLCHGAMNGSASAVVSGGSAPYTFDWRGPDSTHYSTQDITGIGAGTYELVVVDANQCTFTVQATIGQPDSLLTVALSLAEYGGGNTTCVDSNDGAITTLAAGGTPGYTYSWTGPNGFSSAQDSISGLAPGVYAITVTDANGCSISDSATVVPAPPVTLSINAITYPGGTMISCFGASDGAIMAAISGGHAPYTHTWTGPGGYSSSDLSPFALAAGTYYLAVVDSNGCSVQDSITLIGPDELTVGTIATHASCGLDNGAIDASITGGSPAFTTVWDNGAQTEDLANLAPGTYTITVTDANDCSATATATITGSPAVETSSATSNPLCHGSADGSIDLTVSAGTAPFTFLWSTGATDEDLQGLAGGMYSVTVTDANGCTSQQAITVDAPAELVADTVVSQYASGHNVSTWNGNDGSIELNVTGGTPPYSYAWNDGSGDADRHGLHAGTYTVTVTDANGCILELTFILTEPDDIRMPTGFTPNGDGDNDFFVVQGIEAFPENQITVFNRWGNVVYDQLRYSNQWGGENQQGQQLPNGTYFVVLRLNAEQTLQNYVDLRR